MKKFISLAFVAVFALVLVACSPAAKIETENITADFLEKYTLSMDYPTEFTVTEELDGSRFFSNEDASMTMEFFYRAFDEPLEPAAMIDDYVDMFDAYGYKITNRSTIKMDSGEEFVLVEMVDGESDWRFYDVLTTIDNVRLTYSFSAKDEKTYKANLKSYVEVVKTFTVTAK